MAAAPLLQVSDISLTFGGNPLFSGVDVVVQPAARIALVGRNGSGKSTLMKVMAGLAEPDQGSVIAAAGVDVGYLEQDPDMAAFSTLGDFACRHLDEHETYRIEKVAQGLKFDPDALINTASGGERRRAALAGLLAQAPAVLLLDEPTNHLDIEAISWLETQLRTTRSAFILISHDRAFLRNLTHATLWIDRSVVRQQEQGFDGFEAWRDKIWAEEDLDRHKLNRKIKAEAKWAVEGISARRKRNQGRVRALRELRAQQSGAISRQGTAGLAFEAGQKSGKRVIDADGIAKAFGTLEILKRFSIRVARGERIALVGPNGVGKTTLLKMLVNQETPDAGTVKLGSNLEIVTFDQSRTGLMPDKSLWENLTGDPDMAVSGKADQIMVRSTPRHVVGYLKDFLFSDAQARAPVRSLSGGEKSRLLLACLMARQSNLLVLDEPTNDLDIETLDLLQELLAEYNGTVLFVSHDRDFIDRVATTTIAMEGDGQAVIYAGGWSDYQTQRKSEKVATTTENPKAEKVVKAAIPINSGLTFTQKHRLAELPNVIANLAAEIAKLTDLLSDSELFSRDPDRFRKASDALAVRQASLVNAEEEWLILEERAANEQ